MSSHLIREYVRALVSEVDVLSPDKDPRMGGTSHDTASTSNNPADPNKKKIGHSKEYGNKEATRDKVQKVIAKKVKGGGIASDDDLSRYISDPKRIRQDGEFEDDEDVDLAITALKMVPVSVWRQMQ